MTREVTAEHRTSRGPASAFVRYPPAHTPLPLGALLRAGIRSIARPHASVAELERCLLDRYRAERALLYASGTQALGAAIRMADDGRGRAVALPAYNCYDIATAAVAADVRVLFYDIDPDTLSPDWDSFDAALAQGAGTAVVASLYGIPIDWARATEAAGAHGATLIEDAAQGIGGTWRGAPLGSLGEISVLSFGRGKGWTGGGGGAVLLRGVAAVNARLLQPKTATPLAGVRVGVAAAAQSVLSNPRLYAIPASVPWLHLGETRYRPPSQERGLAPVSAALLLDTVQAADEEVRFRTTTGQEFQERLAGATHARTIRVPIDGTAGYLRFPLRVPSASLRDQVLRNYSAAGVVPGYPGRITDLADMHSRLARGLPACSGAATLVRETITLPTHSRSTAASIAHLIDFLS